MRSRPRTAKTGFGVAASPCRPHTSAPSPTCRAAAPTRKFVADGFNLPEGRNSAVWLDRDTLLISSSLGAGMSTPTGDPRTVRLWRRGTDPLAAPVIFETKDGIGVWASVDRTVAHERVLFIEKSSFLDSNFWIGDPAGPKTHLDVPTDAWVQVDRDFIVVKPRTPWTIGGE